LTASKFATTPVDKALWAELRDALPNYAAGSWGPTAADALMQADGRGWWTRA